MENVETKQRMIQGSVPGKQVTRLRIIAADVATKAADIGIGFLDKFGETLVITGDVSSVESSMNEVLAVFGNILKFSVMEITRS